MPRPKKLRWISCRPGISFFKPQGVPLRILDQVCIGVDELEAMRLADLESLSQEEAAQRMNVSRATFGRIVARGRNQVTDALVNGKAILIEGGEVTVRPTIPPFSWFGGPHRRGKGPWR
jgi:predicted DNA-binding protein (UPF0251 family)